LVRPLVMHNHEVTVFDTFWFGDYLPKSIHRIKIDARTLTESDIAGFDTIIFLAGLSNDPMADFNPLLNFELNAALPAYLIDLARRAGVKTFIHGGSCSVYGRMDRIATENDDPKTFSPYGVSKLLGEKACLHYSSPNLRVVCFRMGTVCGFSPRMRFDLVINAMVKDAITKRKIVVNDPDAMRPILDMHDAVKAYLSAVSDSHIHGIINLATSNANVMVLATHVQETLRKELGIKAIIENRGVTDLRSYSVNIDHARTLGFAPERTLFQTVEDLICHFDFNTIQGCEDDRYYNIKIFEKMFEQDVFSQRPPVRELLKSPSTMAAAVLSPVG